MSRVSEVGPSFFLVGAAKSGTTSLARYFAGHPRLFLSNPKEPNFFAFSENVRPSCVGPADPEQLYEKLLKYSVTTRSAYDKLFEAVPKDAVAGEASVRYLYEPTTAERIATTIPDAKILVLLRDPVERLHSHYHMNLRHGLEPLGLHDAVRAEDERVEAGWGWDWHYRRVGLYGEQLQRYFERFPEDRRLVLFHSELNASPQTVYAKACRFLGVDPSEAKPDFSRRSLVGVAPRRRWLQRMVWEDGVVKRVARAVVPKHLRERTARRVNEANRTKAPPPSERLREELAPRFAADRALLERLLGGEVPW